MLIGQHNQAQFFRNDAPAIGGDCDYLSKILEHVAISQHGAQDMANSGVLASP